MLGQLLTTLLIAVGHLLDVRDHPSLSQNIVVKNLGFSQTKLDLIPEAAPEHLRNLGKNI